jgi:hypothetical protein
VLSETLSTLSDAAAAQPLPQVERKYRHSLTGVIVVLYAAIFIVTMSINNCPKHAFPTNACFPTVFCRFANKNMSLNILYSCQTARKEAQVKINVIVEIERHHHGKQLEK